MGWWRRAYSSWRSAFTDIRKALRIIAVPRSGRATLFDLAVAPGRLGPRVGAPRYEAPRADALREQPPALGERADLAAGDRLHQQVPGRRGLDRPREHGPSRGIGGGLVQIGVERAAADDVDAGNRPARKLLDRGEHRRVPQRQRIED